MFRMAEQRVLAKGLIERIGLAGPVMKYERFDGVETEEDVPSVKTHTDALELVCQKLVDPEVGVLKDLTEVQAIGHRVLHGGSKITHSVLIDEEVKETVKSCIHLGPLHNPANLDGIIACEKVFPGVPNVGVFDTAFHQSMPPSSYLYAIPYDLYEKHDIRKYGFHGTSHKFVCQATTEFLGLPADKIKMIICHLGNGSSLCAVDGGKVLDTSMGLTPLDGLIMGTRSGCLDPAVVLTLIKLGMSADEVDNLLNKKSGLYALGGIESGDMRDMVNSAAGGNEKAKLAIDMFMHRLMSYIGSYYATLGGVDAIVFTGGIGENSIEIRSEIMKRLAVFGCQLDESKRELRGEAAVISTPESKIKAVVMPTNEELMIAKETLEVLAQ
jgi:acetate kinase